MAEQKDIELLIVRYVNGKLSGEALRAFEERLEQDESLKKEVAFRKLMVMALKMDPPPRPEKTNRISRKKLLAGFLLVLALFISAYLFFFNENTNEGPAASPFLMVMGNEAQLNISDRANAIAIGPDGDLGIIGTYRGMHPEGENARMITDSTGVFLGTWSEDLRIRNFTAFSSPEGNLWPTTLRFDSQQNLIIGGNIYNRTVIGQDTFLMEGEDDIGQSEFMLAKFNPAMQLQWMVHAGGKRMPNKKTGTNRTYTADVDQDNNIIFAASFVNEIHFKGQTYLARGSNEDILIAKLSPAGKLMWSTTLGSDFKVVVNQVKISKGNVYLTGTFGHHNLGGELYVEADTLQSRGGRDGFLLKLGNGGKAEWVKTFGSDAGENGFDAGEAMAIDSRENILVTGSFVGKGKFGDAEVTSRGGRDVFLACYSNEGRMLWVRTGGSRGGGYKDSPEVGNAITVDADNNIYLTGEFTGPEAQFGSFRLHPQGKNDLFVASYSPEGAIKWIRQFGGDAKSKSADSGMSIQTDPDGHITVAGFFSGSMELDGRTIEAKGREDIFLIRLDAEGNIVFVKTAMYV